mmetsp:Transcript_24778/g.41388  ORF Transcript_24778/g.41388 Transcript_24778/m.41388 type:complete len:377 (+) Transcript_24778:52-1182(+)
MMIFVSILLIACARVQSFQLQQSRATRLMHNFGWQIKPLKMAFVGREGPVDITSTSVEDPLAKISIEEVLSPPRVDWRSIMFLVAGQGVLLGGTTILSDMLGMDHFMGYFLPNFDPDSMKFALTVSLPLIVGGLLVDRLPVRVFQDIARDTRVFTLRILGRASNPLVAAVVALLISMAAGYSEEICFRGFLFDSLSQNFGDVSASVASSVAFGMLHAPLFGSSILVEAVLGAVLCYSYVASGYNIAVPIAVHTMFDFFTLFLTWFITTMDLKTRVQQAEKEIATFLPFATSLPEEFQFIAAAVFDLLDANGDGRIDEMEFTAGMQLFGVGTVPLGVPRNELRSMFASLDKDEDGYITYEDYTAMFRDLIKKWMTMM